MSLVRAECDWLCRSAQSQGGSRVLQSWDTHRVQGSILTRVSGHPGRRFYDCKRPLNEFYKEINLMSKKVNKSVVLSEINNLGRQWWSCVTPLVELIDVFSVVHAFWLNTCRNSVVQQLARTTRTHVIRCQLGGHRRRRTWRTTCRWFWCGFAQNGFFIYSCCPSFKICSAMITKLIDLLNNSFPKRIVHYGLITIVWTSLLRIFVKPSNNTRDLP